MSTVFVQKNLQNFINDRDDIAIEVEELLLIVHKAQEAF